MENSIYIALSRQVALRRAMDATAHNVANMSTPGFRAAHPLFREALTATGPGEASSFVSQAGDYKDMRTGALRRTGSPLHAAVVGPGFFAARAPSGQVAYTKAGEFQRGPDGALLTAGGASVLSQGGGAITLPAGAQSVSIDGRGVISADGARVAQLSVVEFTDPAALTPIGNGLAVTDQAPQEGAVSRVASGVVESSNVEPVVEMTGMVEILRSYQSMQRLLQAENDRLRGAIEKLAKV